jgi:hypothetical protein
MSRNEASDLFPIWISQMKSFILGSISTVRHVSLLPVTQCLFSSIFQSSSALSCPLRPVSQASHSLSLSLSICSLSPHVMSCPPVSRFRPCYRFWSCSESAGKVRQMEDDRFAFDLDLLALISPLPPPLLSLSIKK